MQWNDEVLVPAESVTQTRGVPPGHSLFLFQTFFPSVPFILPLLTAYPIIGLLFSSFLFHLMSFGCCWLPANVRVRFLISSFPRRLNCSFRVLLPYMKRQRHRTTIAFGWVSHFPEIFFLFDFLIAHRLDSISDWQLMYSRRSADR